LSIGSSLVSNIKLFSVAPFMGSWHTRYTIWNK
jgi:hypothetical protein